MRDTDPETEQARAPVPGHQLTALLVRPHQVADAQAAVPPGVAVVTELPALLALAPPKPRRAARPLPGWARRKAGLRAMSRNCIGCARAASRSAGLMMPACASSPDSTRNFDKRATSCGGALTA